MQSAMALRGQPLRVQAPRSAAAPRRAAVCPAALFGFLSPPKAKAAQGRAQELVDELLELSSRTDSGLNASQARRDQIAELVDELEGFCMRNPLRSPLFYGDYEVTYSAKPLQTGGPFRSLPGRIVFPGQRPIQSIVAPNRLVNQLSFKALGFIPGAVRQEGEITPLSADTFQVVLTDGGQRLFQIVYLDDRVRVTRSLASEEAGTQGSLYVFKRIAEEEEEEEEEAPPAPPKRGAFAFGTRKMKAAAQEEEEEEEEAEQAPRGRRGLGTQLLGRKEGLATMAERRYAKQQGSQGTGSRGTGSQGTQAHKSREEVAAERAAAREAAEAERARQREEAAKAKAAAEAERARQREQQEAERARQAQLKEQAKEQMAALTAEAAEAVDEAKQAAAAVKEAEKAASDLLKQAGQARGLIDQAASAAAGALQQIEALKGAEKEAAEEVSQARALIRQLTGRK